MQPLEAKPVDKDRNAVELKADYGEDLDRYERDISESNTKAKTDDTHKITAGVLGETQIDNRHQENDSDLGYVNIAFMEKENSNTSQEEESTSTEMRQSQKETSTGPPNSTTSDTNIDSFVKLAKSYNLTEQPSIPAEKPKPSGMIPPPEVSALRRPVAAPPTSSPPTSSPRLRAISGGSRTNMHTSSIRSLHSLYLSKNNMSSLSVSKRDLASPLYRKNIFYSGSVQNISQTNVSRIDSKADMQSYIASITTIPGEMDLVDSPSGSSRCMARTCFCLPGPVRDVLSEMVDLSLLRNPIFIFICLGNFAAYLGFYCPFAFLLDVAVSKGIDKSKGAFLISIIGIANIIWRVLTGKLADSGLVSSLVIIWVSITVCGVSTVAIPYCDSFIVLAAMTFVFGSGMAGFMSITSVLICDQLGVDKLTNASGLIYLVRGIASMIGCPFTAFLCELTGCYLVPFMTGGLLLLLGAVFHMMIHLPCLHPSDKVTFY